MKLFGPKLILRKITKTVATGCHILMLKCIKFEFGWGNTPNALGSLQGSPTQLDLRGATSKGRERKERA